MTQDTSTQQLLPFLGPFENGMVFKSGVGFGILMSEGQYNFVAQDTETTIYFNKNFYSGFFFFFAGMYQNVNSHL